tara:strand:- start:2625 stop:2906 length:282 start_codon:yes stop_codon:yes gene_type:complete
MLSTLAFRTFARRVQRLSTPQHLKRTMSSLSQQTIKCEAAQNILLNTSNRLANMPSKERFQNKIRMSWNQYNQQLHAKARASAREPDWKFRMD